MLPKKQTELTPEHLRDIRDILGYTNKEMAELTGVTLKTWINKISSSNDTKKLLTKMEYLYLLYLVEQKLAGNEDAILKEESRRSA